PPALAVYTLSYTTLFRSVPPAVATDDVRSLHRVAPGAATARRTLEAPGARPSATGLGLGGFLLGNGHLGSSSTCFDGAPGGRESDRKSTRLNSSHVKISY